MHTKQIYTFFIFASLGIAAPVSESVDKQLPPGQKSHAPADAPADGRGPRRPSRGGIRSDGIRISSIHPDGIKISINDNNLANPRKNHRERFSQTTVQRLDGGTRTVKSEYSTSVSSGNGLTCCDGVQPCSCTGSFCCTGFGDSRRRTKKKSREQKGDTEIFTEHEVWN
ncbi:hypothetical protein MCOR02_001206 [Pyricularia oryzae]|uniref:Uncharacterized protein n=1 Tax=Pyricularia oryzae TaxID=318829 RepID=A0A4P7MZ35_PYROR|nr:hypothetical protein MCOR01_011352 [Pyricularia oryzae]KAH9437549.1 hypothetical protein MCOR02_001206 [Pyricularia oryzae]KAI6260273.1 hypothetical protein MCOR19_003406 [Pyricularia oryzae]KAI6284515.1 hypothetical protein MCOR26_001935 [Pyricularia oryzae]KAI6315758.1 hypothetical protein MCOR29_006854 [Pyricularia oryzae]